MAATPTSTLTKERAITMLGQGLPPSVVASTLGVEPSLISQFMADPDFSSVVSESRYKNLAKHNETDSNIDNLESKLVDKLEKSLVYITRPMEMIKAFQVINAAKRRGQTAPDHLTQQNSIIALTIPSVVLNKMTVNVHNQVVKIGEKSLLTMPSSRLLALTEISQLENKKANVELDYVPQSQATTLVGEVENVASRTG